MSFLLINKSYIIMDSSGCQVFFCLTLVACCLLLVARGLLLEAWALRHGPLTLYALRPSWLDPRSMVQTKRALECQLPWIRAQGRDEASNRLQASPPVRTPLTLAGVVVLVVGLDIIYNIG